MPDQPRAFDVWIAESEKIYRAVPFTVVGDWIQEGRILEDDRVRPAGTTAWQRLREAPLLSSYLPQPVPYRTEDQAETLEPVETEISWKRSAEDEDDEVDMIPLIDISLVLLIFFMMTAGAMLASSLLDMPEADHGKVIEPTSSTLSVGVDLAEGQVRYFLGDQMDQPLTEREIISEVANKVKTSSEKPEVLLKAAANVPFERIQQLTIGLEKAGVKRIMPNVKDKSGGGD